MKIEINKTHHYYVPGVHEVSTERGNYLIKTGIARKAGSKDDVPKAAPKKKGIS